VDGLVLVAIDRGKRELMQLCLLPQEIVIEEYTVELFLCLPVAEIGTLLH
jgi:hypothetical protein